MKQIRRKRISIIAVLVFILSLTLTVSLVYADNIVLTDANPDFTITTGTTATVYGTAGANHVTLESGAKAELVNFPGSNTITVESYSNLFTVSRSGSAVTFQGSDGTWYCYNSENKTHSVAQKSPNSWGLYDMHGNVWEWCQDWYGDYSTAAVTDPVGPGSGSGRVVRGGGWSYDAQYCRSAVRGRNYPSNWYGYLGFRLVCSAGHQ